MGNETDEVVSGVITLAMAVEDSGPLSFAEILDLGAEIAGRLADEHDHGDVHGHVGPGSIVRLEEGPWRLAPADLIPDLDPVPAPEQLVGDRPTPAADVFALGATLSYGLTGTMVEPTDGTERTGEAGPVDPAADTDAADAPLDDPAPTAGLTLDELAEADEVLEATVADLGDDPTGPVTLPEVMTSFLVTLRATLAADPASRPSASSLAATLRQLRSDAETALGGAFVAGAVTAVAIGDGAAAEPWGAPQYDTSAAEPVAADPGEPAVAVTGGDLAVEGTGAASALPTVSAAKKTSLKERAPVLVAAAAVIVAVFLGVSLVNERNAREEATDLLATGPTVGTVVRRTTTTPVPIIIPVDTLPETTTTLASSTTTTTAPPAEEVVPDTTLPPDTLPPSTLPTTALPTTTTTRPTTTTTRPPQAGIPVTVVCGSPAIPCPVPVFSEPSTLPPSQLKGSVPNGAQLVAQCGEVGELVGSSNVWYRIIGQVDFFWIPRAAVSTSGTPPPCA